MSLINTFSRVGLGLLLANAVACDETIPSTGCEISPTQDVSVDSADSKIDNHPSGIPATTLLIMKHVAGCYAGLRDSEMWCNNFILERLPSEPNFCDANFPDGPKNIQDICKKRTQDCLDYSNYKAFTACLESIPADSACEAKLRPLSAGNDTDGDGLSDHFELWHSNTNPCEPYSFGKNAARDDEADNDGDGVNNYDAQAFSGGCMSYVATEECG